MDLNSFGVAQMDYKTLGPLRMTYFLSAPPWDNLPSPPPPSLHLPVYTHTLRVVLLPAAARTLPVHLEISPQRGGYFLLLRSGTAVHLLGARVA